MKVLLDTHAFLWWLADDPRLSLPAAISIDNPDHQVLFSAASAWEISTKHRIGKLPSGGLVVDRLPDILRRLRFTPFAMSVEHAQLAGQMPGAHKDPFDRMLAAQAIIEDIAIVTNDSALAGLGCRTTW